MNPEAVYAVAIPNAHKTSSTTQIVQSIFSTFGIHNCKRGANRPVAAAHVPHPAAHGCSALVRCSFCS